MHSDHILSPIKPYLTICPLEKERIETERGMGSGWGWEWEWGRNRG
jgi:hypothetical protein